MQIRHSHLVLDACCILNLSTSGYLISILKTISAQAVVTIVVKERELLTLQRSKNSDNENAIELESAITQGLLLIVDFESEQEEETFVNYVFELGDDGESATGAIAFHRGWAIATDDKKAGSFFAREAPHLQVLSTLEIIKSWSEGEKLTEEKLHEVLGAIRTRGRYKPPRSHPLFNWWENIMQ